MRLRGGLEWRRKRECMYAVRGRERERIGMCIYAEIVWLYVCRKREWAYICRECVWVYVCRERERVGVYIPREYGMVICEPRERVGIYIYICRECVWVYMYAVRVREWL